jgi:hypothetical protein
VAPQSILHHPILSHRNWWLTKRALGAADIHVCDRFLGFGLCPGSARERRERHGKPKETICLDPKKATKTWGAIGRNVIKHDVGHSEGRLTLFSFSLLLDKKRDPPLTSTCDELAKM